MHSCAAIWLAVLAGTTMAIGVIAVWFVINERVREHITSATNYATRINEALAFDAGKRKNMAERQQLLDKVAAQDLGISVRTVEVHRSQIMKKLGVRMLAQLVRIKIEAEPSRAPNS